MKSGLLAGILSLMAIIGVACSGGAAQTQDVQSESPSEVSAEIETSREESSPEGGYVRPDEIPLIKGPVSPDGLQAIFGTPDLGVGEQRVSVVLTSKSGLVRSPAATITSFYFPTENSEGEARQTRLAVFRPFPLNTRGMYTTDLEFDKPGRWGLEISVLDENANTQRAELFFDVAESTAAPSAGAPAVASANKTIRDVDSISRLTTGTMHDPDLYQTTIADAIRSGMPTVVVMASPAFCTNAVCGPQVDVLQQLKNKYKGQANFIHVDFYDNPEGIQGDLNNALLSPTVIEWNLPSTEWSFVIDEEGIISARFESFATFEEIEEALLEVI